MNRTMGEKIKAVLATADKSQRWLAEAAKIPEATLRRNIETDNFTVPQAERIVVALGVTGADILPDSLLRVNA